MTELHIQRSEILNGRKCNRTKYFNLFRQHIILEIPNLFRNLRNLVPAGGGPAHFHNEGMRFLSNKFTWSFQTATKYYLMSFFFWGDLKCRIFKIYTILLQVC